MKFGKLSDLSGVDFSMPPRSERTRQILGGAPAPKFKAYVGLSRWASDEWKEVLYPKGAKQADYLRHYARAFNTIELNTTHYRTPDPDTVRKWAEQAGPEFVFCPKVPQGISHYRKLADVEADTARFAEAVRAFGSKLGCVFLQLHDSFGPSLRQNLLAFAAAWPPDVPLAVEFRHEGWFRAGGLIPEACDILEAAGIGTVITDVAGRRDVHHDSLTSRTAMIRFVGNELHPSDYQRIDAWMERLAWWVSQGLEQLYLFPHEGGDLMAAQMGAHVMRLLDARFALGLNPPPLAIQPAAPPSGQLPLF